MDVPEPGREELIEKIRMLEERLYEVEQTIEAIRNGEIEGGTTFSMVFPIDKQKH